MNGNGPTTCMGGSGSCSAGNAQPPTVGTVTDFSDTSITIKTDSGTKTYTIDSNTQMIAGPGTSPTGYSASSVTKNMKVGVVTSTSDSTKVQMLLLDYSGMTTTN